MIVIYVSKDKRDVFSKKIGKRLKKESFFMTKTKTSTVAIVVLSVLLAAALASTIVLAAFSFGRSATTTITFGSGVTLTATGITNGKINVRTISSDGVRAGSADTSGNLTNITQGVAIEPIVVTNASSNTSVRIAYAIRVTKPGASGSITPFYKDAEAPDGTYSNKGTLVTWDGESPNYAAKDNNCTTHQFTATTTAAASGYWYVSEVVAASSTLNLIDWINTAYTLADLGAIEGSGATLTLYIAAVPATATYIADLTSVIAAENFVAFSA